MRKLKHHIIDISIIDNDALILRVIIDYNLVNVNTGIFVIGIIIKKCNSDFTYNIKIHCSNVKIIVKMF